MFNPQFWHVKDCSYQFLSKSIKVDLQSQFLGSKNVIFFGTLKSILKMKNSKKGLSSSFLATIYYMHAKFQVRTIIIFRSGEGGGQLFEGLSSYYVHTCIYIYIMF